MKTLKEQVIDWGSVELQTIDNQEITIDFVDDKHGERFVVWIDGEIKKIAKQFNTVEHFIKNMDII